LAGTIVVFNCRGHTLFFRGGEVQERLVRGERGGGGTASWAKQKKNTLMAGDQRVEAKLKGEGKGYEGKRFLRKNWNEKTEPQKKTG